MKYFKKHLKKYFKKLSRSYPDRVEINRLILVVFLAGLFILGVYLAKEFLQPVEPEQPKVAYGSASDNVTGWAWGGGEDTIPNNPEAGSGWISFNCYNYYNLAVDNTITDRCSPAPTYYDYGVNIDSSTGGFSGEAWSGGGQEAGADAKMLGWISFDRSATGNPPAPPYNDGVSPIANLSFGTGRVRGWMKALAADGNGWDGWIKLGDDTGNWSGTDQKQVKVNLESKRFCGWAWGSDVVGWISFNIFCDKGTAAEGNCDVDGNGLVDAGAPLGCAAAGTNMPPLPGEGTPPIDINFPPTADYYSVVTWDCCTESRNPYLTWTFEGLDQKAYQIQIDDGDFSVPANIEWDYTATDGTYSSPTTYRKSSGTELDWDTSYNWRVRVKDSADNWSEWTNWQANPTLSGFTTPTHAYPDISFSYAPRQPSAGENVSFADQSICDDLDGGCLHPSKGGNDTYSWTFTLIDGTGILNWDADDYPSPYTYLDYDNPVVSFSEPGTWNVKLEITDGSGEIFDGQLYECSSEIETIYIREPLPWWKEIIPR